jgi:hypothetical protein
MAGNTGIADLWAGAAAPRINPEPIEKTWRNDRDPTRRRATFGVLYPLLGITIERSGDLPMKLPARFETTKRRSVQGVRFYLKGTHLIFSDADFHECKFHKPDALQESKVSASTFKNCRFKRCMFGGTVFRHVTFEDSTFSRCDFEDSEFSECQFVDCMFTECTAENASFIATEVDPTAFLRGMPPPVYNCEEPTPDGEATPAQLAADWVEVRRKLAAQLLKSNAEIYHTDHSDRGVFELKRAELKARVQALRVDPLQEGVPRFLVRAGRICTAWLILNVTKGGTSLSRLLLTATLIVALYALLLSTSHITFINQDCHLNNFDRSLVLQQLARAESLFLAFGYTAFSGGPRATVLLTAGAAIGLFWYALVAAVVIHRVYR